MHFSVFSFLWKPTSIYVVRDKICSLYEQSAPKLVYLIDKIPLVMYFIRLYINLSNNLYVLVYYLNVNCVLTSFSNMFDAIQC